MFEQNTTTTGAKAMIMYKLVPIFDEQTKLVEIPNSFPPELCRRCSPLAMFTIPTTTSTNVIQFTKFQLY